jgi:hypothetical protein
LASKVTRSCLIAVSAIGASGLVAVSAAEAAPPTIPTALVNQPAVAGVLKLTPESARLTGVVDTGGNPGTTFVVPANTTLSWDNSFSLITTTAAVTEHIDGLPSDGSSMLYPTSSASETLNNSGEDNYSTVLFEADPATDYANNGNNFGPETVDAAEVNVSTFPGLSQVAATVGGYPAAQADPLSGPLTPGTKYVYGLEQQVGATDSGVTVNTYTPGTTGVNPSYSCFPLAYVAATSPYNGYSTTGTLSGGVTSTGGPAQTNPEPQIQGPCVYYYGGGSNYYLSPVGTFTTPSLGAVTFTAGSVTATKAVVRVTDASVEDARGSVEFDYKGKSVGTSKFVLAAKNTKPLNLTLTSYGKHLLAGGSTFNVTPVLTDSTDQPTTTKSVTL